MRVTPSTVAVTLQVPEPTAVTVPSEETVATEVLLEAQDTVELVPETVSRQLLSEGLLDVRSRVKSSRLSLRPEAEELEELEELDVLEELEALPSEEEEAEVSLKVQRTMQDFSPTPATLAVRVTVPWDTAVTVPSQDTEATLGLLEVQVMSPLAFSGV